jgi:predicted transport protein
MSENNIERFFCNICRGKTKHFIRAKHEKHDDDGQFWFQQNLLIIECCGCENLALVKKTLFSEDVFRGNDPHTGEEFTHEPWDEVIYPPVTYRTPPLWFDDLPDPTLRAISDEIYKSLQTGSHYLATFGSRTLIDRLIVLTVGDRGNFAKGLLALQDEGKLSLHEREILNPVVDAGNAAAHRGWAPTKEQLAIILDTVEGLIHRLLVLPKMAEELEEAVPNRGGGKAKLEKIFSKTSAVTAKDKINAAPKDLRAIYEELAGRLKALGKDVTMNPQKHYMAFRRNRNFASVQIYNQKRVVRVYLNLDPDMIKFDAEMMRDVRQIGHFGTGDLEITIKTKKDIEKVLPFFEASYAAS